MGQSKQIACFWELRFRWHVATGQRLVISVLLGFGRIVSLRLLGLRCRLHGLLETLDGLAQITADIAQTLGAEQQQHDGQNDKNLPDADAAHKPISSANVNVGIVPY